jgi:AcrR family transcriptional regulator
MIGTKKRSITKNQSEVFPNHLIRLSTKNVPLVESKHRQIVDGACRTFFKKGYHPTTIREIAKSCGMSMGQLYHYISSKDDVLYLVHRHMQKLWYEYLKKADLEQIEDPLQKLIKSLYCNLQFIIENKKLIQFIYTESKYLDKKHLRVVLEMDYNNVIGFWRSLLGEINKPKSVKGDLDFLASLIAYLVVFLSLRGWTLRDRPTKKSVDSSVDFILRGLGVME